MIASAPQERDPKLTGRILDALTMGFKGILIGLATAGWVGLASGVALEILRAKQLGIADVLVKGIIGAAAVTALIYVTLDNLRTIYYTKLLANSDAATRVPRYQANLARKTTPFHSWHVLIWLLISLGILSAVATLVAISSEENPAFILICAAVALGGVLGGRQLLLALRRLRAWYATQMDQAVFPPVSAAVDGSKYDEEANGAQAAQTARVVPESPVGGGLKRAALILERLAGLVTAVTLIGFVVWAASTGRVTVIGDRIQVLPESFHRELTETDELLGQIVGWSLAGAALLMIVVSIPVFIFGIIIYRRAHRALNEAALFGGEPLTTAHREVTAVALTNLSTSRRINFYGSAVAVGFLIVGLLAPRAELTGGTALSAAGIALLLTVWIIDISAQPRERAARNSIMKTWPNAQQAEN